MFSSETSEYGTPGYIWRPIRAALRLDTDAAASIENHLLPEYMTMDGTYRQHFSTPNKVSDDNGLTASWAMKRVWCNPPYGRKVTEQWVKKAALETAYYGTDYGSELTTRGRCQVAALLLPARPDTDWFQSWVAPYATVYFVQGRIKFIGHTEKCIDREPHPAHELDAAPFPSIIAVYGRDSAPKPGHLNGRLWDPRSQPDFPD